MGARLNSRGAGSHQPCAQPDCNPRPPWSPRKSSSWDETLGQPTSALVQGLEGSARNVPAAAYGHAAGKIVGSLRPFGCRPGHRPGETDLRFTELRLLDNRRKSELQLTDRQRHSGRRTRPATTPATRYSASGSILRQRPARLRVSIQAQDANPFHSELMYLMLS